MADAVKLRSGSFPGAGAAPKSWLQGCPRLADAAAEQGLSDMEEGRICRVCTDPAIGSGASRLPLAMSMTAVGSRQLDSFAGAVSQALGLPHQESGSAREAHDSVESIYSAPERPEGMPGSGLDAVGQTDADEADITCCICFEATHQTDSVVFAACGKTAHRTCMECMKTHLTLRIEEGRVHELCCPGSRMLAEDDVCTAQASEAEISQWLEPELYSKYMRFCQMRHDPSLRACPHCEHLCGPQSRDIIMCEACSGEFCYYHSNAHAPTEEACAEYTRRLAEQEQLMEGALDTRPCPRCSVPTSKLSGCNHMTCRCSCHWCWLCQREVDNPGWHFNPMNPVGCLQFYSEGSPSSSRRRSWGCQSYTSKALLLLCKVICLPMVIWALLAYAVFGLLLLLFSPLLLCRCCNSERRIMVWICACVAVVGIPFALIALVWACIGFIIWLAMYPLGAGEAHMQLLLCAPVLAWFALSEGLQHLVDDSGSERSPQQEDIPALEPIVTSDINSAPGYEDAVMLNTQASLTHTVEEQECSTQQVDDVIEEPSEVRQPPLHSDTVTVCDV